MANEMIVSRQGSEGLLEIALGEDGWLITVNRLPVASLERLGVENLSWPDTQWSSPHRAALRAAGYTHSLAGSVGLHAEEAARLDVAWAAYCRAQQAAIAARAEAVRREEAALVRRVEMRTDITMRIVETLPVERWEGNENIEAGECHRWHADVTVAGEVVPLLLAEDDEFGSRVVSVRGETGPGGDLRDATDAETCAIVYARRHWPERSRTIPALVQQVHERLREDSYLQRSHPDLDAE